jgi:hypothetical protein
MNIGAFKYILCRYIWIFSFQQTYIPIKKKLFIYRSSLNKMNSLMKHVDSDKEIKKKLELIVWILFTVFGSWRIRLNKNNRSQS